MKASLQLTGVSDYHGIQFGRDGKNLYVIGRGKSLEDREMSFHIPSMAEYGGGKQPKFRWVSGNSHTTLAELEASSGNMYIKGRVGIGAMSPKSALDVRGGVNIQNAKGEAVITFPKGEGSGFYIRSTDNPAETSDADNRLYISGKNGFVGVATSQPKTMLDVRGALNLQDATGAAILYFPEKGKSSSFFIRCADDPAKYEESQERLFVGSNGMVGIGTGKPTHGLTLDSPARPGSPVHDVAIKKGNLHLAGSIFDLSSGNKYYIDLKKDSYLKRASIETSLGIGTTKPVSMQGSSSVVHVSDPAAPLVRIENTKAGGSANLELRSGNSAWSATGSTAAFELKYNGKSHLTVTNDGKIGVGTKTPTHGLTIESEYPEGHANNDLSIRKGHLWIYGAIKQLGSSKYSFSIDKGGFIKHLNVEGKLGIGLFGKEPKFNMELGAGKIMSLGNQMFFSGESGTGYVTANLYRKDNKWNLFKGSEGGAMIALKSTGAIEISGTEKAGSTNVKTMMTIDAVTQTAVFPQAGMKAGFGTSSPAYPIHVVGAARVGDAQASIAFGQTEATMGFLGANQKYVFMATKDGQQALALDQFTGNVGIGTTRPQTPLHIAHPKEASLSLGSSQAKDTHAFIKAKGTADGVDMIMGVKNPKKGASKLTFQFKNTVTFAGSGKTVFARGDTLFKSGNVGIGGSVFDPKFKLHIKGDTKIDGRCFVSKTRPAAKSKEKKEEPKLEELDHLDFTDLLEEDEHIENHDESRQAIDLVGTMSSLSRVIRKQLKQMEMHDQRIESLATQLQTLSNA